MNVTTPHHWTKRFPTPASCQAAAAHHHWLTELGTPVPQLHTTTARHLVFDYVTGRHAEPHDLPHLAELLGRLHNRAYTTELHSARLDRPHTTPNGLTIPDFVTTRTRAINHLLSQGTAPLPPLTTTQTIRAIEAAAGDQPSFYKDCNPRNFLIAHETPTGCVLLDFDVLTLAPAGYDLAKLIVTLTMTHGPLPTSTAQAALTTYNTSLTAKTTDLRPVLWNTLMTWADIHHILTSPYLGRNGYRHLWSGTTTPEPEQLSPFHPSGLVMEGEDGLHDGGAAAG
ncbi:phosphotransferase [Spirillospora sp. NBC_00431]